jgi:hypothetical protein
VIEPNNITRFFSPLRNSIVIIFLSLFSLTVAQVRIGEWTALTSPLNVRDILYIGSDIYAATEGGLFKLKDDEYQTITTIDGLLGVDLSTIASDKNGNLWLGGTHPFGFVQLFNPNTNKPIKSFDYNLTAIFDIQILDSLSFVFFQDGQDMGIMKFLYNNGWDYRDSFRNFPSETESINCFTANDSTIFIGMNNGIYKGSLNDNLKDPTSWQKLDVAISMDVTAIVIEGTNLYFSSSNALYNYSLETTTWSQISFSYTLSNVNEIFVENGDIYFIDGKKLFRKSDDEDSLLNNQYWLSGIAKNSNQIITGIRNGILFIEENLDGNDAVTRFLPNAPVTAGFSAITVLDDGRLVGGSKEGLSIYSEDGWRNILQIKTVGSDTIHNSYDFSKFVADTIPYSFGGFIADLEQGPDGLLYCAIRGTYPIYNSEPVRTSGGVIIIDVDNPSNVTLIDTTYLSYLTESSNPNPYMVILDIEFDSKNNLWIADPYCIIKNNPIHVRSLSGEWKHYGSSETTVKISQSPGALAVDSWNRLWYSAFQAEEANFGIYPNGGIFMLDFDGSPTNPDNFSWKLVQNKGTVLSLGMGLNDRLYYLTSSGLNYFDLSSASNPIVRENAYAYFPNTSFGDGAEIKIDPHGNIWAHSPSQGIHILLENTTYWPTINGFRTDNSPLLSDEITDIAFDEKRNLAYIATSKGVNILRIPFGVEQKNYSNVKVFPSPFYIPSVDPMKVDGLPFESSMMVMTLDGKVVRHVESQGISIDGNQLSWDGRDDAGDYVSSGVYLLALYGMDGSQMVEKITVIKN